MSTEVQLNSGSAYSLYTRQTAPSPAQGAQLAAQAPLQRVNPQINSQPPGFAAPNPTPSPSNWNRFWGAAKAAGGALESAAGIAVAAFTGWSGVGAAAGGAVALHGADTVIAGIRQAVSGRNTATLTSQSLAGLTGSNAAGEVLDAAIGIAGTGGVGLFSKAAAGERLAEKSVTWTSRLWAGEGVTGPYGDMLLSRLGSAVDRAQVFLHEKVHSILSPAAGGFLATLRADLRSFLYSRSQLMRYSEEALAETAAQTGTRAMTGEGLADAVRTGIQFPLKNGYVEAAPLAAEATGTAAKVASSAAQSYRSGEEN
jgi:hypothetical protein